MTTAVPAPSGEKGAQPGVIDLAIAAQGEKQCTLAIRLGWSEAKLTGIKQRIQDPESRRLLSALGLDIAPKSLEAPFDPEKVQTLANAVKLFAAGFSMEQLRRGVDAPNP